MRSAVLRLLACFLASLVELCAAQTNIELADPGDLPGIMSDQTDEHAVLLYNGRKENVLGLFDEVAAKFAEAPAKFVAMDCGLRKCERLLSSYGVRVPHGDVEPLIIFFHRPSEQRAPSVYDPRGCYAPGVHAQPSAFKNCIRSSVSKFLGNEVHDDDESPGGPESSLNRQTNQDGTQNFLFMVTILGLAGIFWLNGGWRSDQVLAYDSEDRFSPPDPAKLASEQGGEVPPGL